MLVSSPTNETRHFIELCKSYKYTQLIKEPTRVTSSSQSLIDLFLTNEPAKFVTSGVSHIGRSDHSLIYVSRKLTCPGSFPRIIKSRQYKNFMPDYFLDDMALVPWDMIELIDNPTRAWEVWKHSVMAVANLHAPVKKKRVRNSMDARLTPEINRLMLERLEQSESPPSLMISWNGQSTDGLKVELAILVRLPKRITPFLLRG